MITLPLSSPEASLENTGGKGASLARLARLGLPVPPGFIVLTHAYRDFVAANSLEASIAEALAGLDGNDGAQLEETSNQLRSQFSTGKLPEEIAAEVIRQYRELDPRSRGVAVRSSATFEDLPELSFAGQQDTFLNVIGEEQLLKALVNCWSSLWTARAIGYRLRNDLPQEQIALAVVVQRMVPSEVAGVLFTANPLSGLRSETVIDATFGLGEALVSGQVEPDHYVVDTESGELKQVRLGAKETSTRGKTGGGVESLREEAGGKRSLSDEQLRKLVTTGRQIQKEYGAPQDIEWAFAGGEMAILQSRPITSLFPLPRFSTDPLIIWFSFGAVQGMINPMTPLGQEAIQRVILGTSKRLHVKVSYESQDIFVTAGERIWIKVSDVIRNPIGYKVFRSFLGFIEPSVAQILQSLLADPRLGASQGRLKFSTLRRLAGFFLPIGASAFRTMISPEAARQRFDTQLEAYLQTVQIPPGADRFERLANFAAFMDAQGGLAEALPTLMPRFIPIFGSAIASLNIIEHLLGRHPNGKHDFSLPAVEVTRGLPRNVTTEMDLALWDAAGHIKADVAAAEAFHSSDASILATHFMEGALPAAAQTAVESFLSRYGARGVGEIDLGQPRWREDPRPVIETLQSYLQIPAERAPDQLFKKGALAAEEAIEQLAAEVRQQRGGWIKEKILRAAARRVRLLMGARESPKFFAVRAMGRVRNSLLEIGAEFAAAGTIRCGDDLFFLQVKELAALARGEERDWKALLAERRQTYERELHRRQVPRLLASDGRAFYEGIGAGSDDEHLINGSPVSPGLVEGWVHVVFDPRQAQLAPGEILVCPGTDPAWTPLFMAAGGLIMEVGGMMTHGSVVAREYGIPAVVGVHQATLRLKDGQRIRLDGSSGRIEILSE
jgi:phosphoenolpyruvate synthase/pyruvate phosphate dikinase